MHGHKLLIVDDQIGVRMLLNELFNEEYHVELAANGYEAVEKFKEETPSLVMLDMKMPGLDGMETLQSIKQLNASVPVIMITASGELMEQAKMLGAADFIQKPFDLNNVRFKVQTLLGENTNKK